MSKSGTLDPKYRDPSVRGQRCAWKKKKDGKRCPNPANYKVEERASCSRDHRPG